MKKVKQLAGAVTMVLAVSCLREVKQLAVAVKLVDFVAGVVKMLVAVRQSQVDFAVATVVVETMLMVVGRLRQAELVATEAEVNLLEMVVVQQKL